MGSTQTGGGTVDSEVGLKRDFESPSLLVLECGHVAGSNRGPATTCRRTGCWNSSSRSRSRHRVRRRQRPGPAQRGGRPPGRPLCPASGERLGPWLHVPGARRPRCWRGSAWPRSGWPRSRDVRRRDAGAAQAHGRPARNPVPVIVTGTVAPCPPRFGGYRAHGGPRALTTNTPPGVPA